MDPQIKQLHKRKIEELAQMAMTAIVISGNHSSAASSLTATKAYDLAEAMTNEHEKRFGPLMYADL